MLAWWRRSLAEYNITTGQRRGVVGRRVWRPLATTPGGGKVNISLSGHEDQPEGLARCSLSAAAGPEPPCPWPATSRQPHAAHAAPPPGYRSAHSFHPQRALPPHLSVPVPTPVKTCLGFCNYHHPVSAGGASALRGPNTLYLCCVVLLRHSRCHHCSHHLAAPVPAAVKNERVIRCHIKRLQ